jgi:hypothetical protein
MAREGKNLRIFIYLTKTDVDEKRNRKERKKKQQSIDLNIFPANWTDFISFSP